MIEAGLRNMRSALMENKDDVRAWASLLLDGAKVGTIGGASLGLLMLLAYLHSVGAPLPLVDASASFTLLVIVAVYAFIMSVLVFALLLPAALCFVSQKFRLITRSRKLEHGLPIPRALRNSGSQYALFQSTAISVIASFSVGIAANLSYPEFLFLILASFPIGIALTIWGFYKRTLVARRSLRANLRSKLALLVGAYSVAHGVICVFWCVFLITTLAAVLPTSEASFLSGQSNASRLGIGLLFAIVAISLFCVLTSVRIRPERIPFGLAFVVIALALLNPAYSGRQVLRFLGIGGGIPVVLLTKTMDPDGTSVFARKLDGCLIVNVGSRIVFQPLSNPNWKGCNAQETGNSAPQPMLASTVVLSQSDILSISGVPPQQ